MGPTRDGVVATFDEARGIGTVRASDGSEHFFHCTAIVDGSRTIAVDTPVTFDVIAGRRGQWEATTLTPTASSPTPTFRRR